MGFDGGKVSTYPPCAYPARTVAPHPAAFPAGLSLARVTRPGRRTVSSYPARTVPAMTEGTTATAAATRTPLAIARWKSGKQHVTRDGATTGCGVLIPDSAVVTRPTLDWYLVTNCYNCAYRLWPAEGPADYLCPSNGADFPPTRKCPHGQHPRGCVRCTPQAAQNWPCPNGCTDPADHNPLHRYTKCTVRPPRKPVGPDERCPDGCESTEKAMQRANPGLSFDLADGASMYCYHCNGAVCVACQRTPVDYSPGLCDRCSADC